MLKAALAVAVLAVGIAEADLASRANLYSLNRDDEIFHLSSVGTDVLHGACSHLARNDREVLCSMPARFYGQCHDVVPGLARADAYQSSFFDRSAGEAGDGRVDHGAMVIACELKDAAPTENQIFLARPQTAGYLFGLLFGGVFYKFVAVGLDAERVVVEEVVM